MPCPWKKSPLICSLKKLTSVLLTTWSEGPAASQNLCKRSFVFWEASCGCKWGCTLLLFSVIEVLRWHWIYCFADFKRSGIDQSWQAKAYYAGLGDRAVCYLITTGWEWFGVKREQSGNGTIIKPYIKTGRIFTSVNSTWHTMELYSITINLGTWIGSLKCRKCTWLHFGLKMARLTSQLFIASSVAQWSIDRCVRSERPERAVIWVNDKQIDIDTQRNRVSAGMECHGSVDENVPGQGESKRERMRKYCRNERSIMAVYRSRRQRAKITSVLQEEVSWTVIWTLMSDSFISLKAWRAADKRFRPTLIPKSNLTSGSVGQRPLYKDMGLETRNALWVLPFLSAAY